jgi:signal peptidase complex subunit 3
VRTECSIRWFSPLTFLSQRGRIQRWGARDEDIASLRFDAKVDLSTLLKSYNVKQLFVYLTAEYVDEAAGEHHTVTLWDDIITRADTRDFRAVATGKNAKKTKGKGSKKGRRGRGKLNLENAKMEYVWRNPGRSFK